MSGYLASAPGVDRQPAEAVGRRLSLARLMGVTEPFRDLSRRVLREPLSVVSRDTPEVDQSPKDRLVADAEAVHQIDGVFRVDSALEQIRFRESFSDALCRHQESRREGIRPHLEFFAPPMLAADFALKGLAVYEEVTVLVRLGEATSAVMVVAVDENAGSEIAREEV